MMNKSKENYLQRLFQTKNLCPKYSHFIHVRVTLQIPTSSHNWFPNFWVIFLALFWIQSRKYLSNKDIKFEIVVCATFTRYLSMCFGSFKIPACLPEETKQCYLTFDQQLTISIGLFLSFIFFMQHRKKRSSSLTWMLSQ